MTSDAHKASGLALGHKILFHFRRCQIKGNVHQAAGALFCVPFVKAIAVIDNIVNNLGFSYIILGHSLHAALLFNPMQSFIDHIDGKNWRSVVKRIIISEGGVFEHGGQLLAGCC